MKRCVLIVFFILFYRFRSFIVIMIIEGWDAVMWKTSPSTNGCFMHVYHIRYNYILVLFFSFFLCNILLTPFYWYTIPWVISIYLLYNCARSWSSVELLGKVASLTTTTSIIPLAVRVIGIELLMFLMIIVGVYDEKIA